MSSLATKARDLVEAGSSGALSTLAEDGAPFGSLVTYATTSSGDVILHLSKLAEHTKNLARDPRASLLVTAPAGDPMASPRVTLVGIFTLAPPDARDALLATFLAKHPSAARYAAFADFVPWVLVPRRVRAIEGFGAMGFIEGPTWLAAWTEG